MTGVYNLTFYTLACNYNLNLFNRIGKVQHHGVITSPA